MATLSNENIFVNIKELPQIGGIERGDLLIVETEDGTNILDFDDLVIDTYQTTFYNILTGNDLELANDIIDIQEDLVTLTATVDQLGGTAFNALSAQINTNVRNISALQSVTTILSSNVIALSAEVNNLRTAALSGYPVKAFGEVQIVGLNSGVGIQSITPLLGVPSGITYQPVRTSTTIPIVGTITPSLRIWNIIFPSSIGKINYVDVQLSSLSWVASRRNNSVSLPILSAGNTWYVSVSTHGPQASDSDFRVRFSAF
jgi:hypothetical protein